MRYRLVQSIDGRYQTVEGDLDRAVEALAGLGFACTGYHQSHRTRAELQGAPTFKGLIGPCWDGDAIRYECPATYAAMSD